MSWTALLEYEEACSREDAPEPPLEWLQGVLKQSMEELMAGEATPLQKANAVARLGNLFLRTYRAAELEQENKALKQRLAELEAALADAGDPDAGLPVSASHVSRAVASEPAVLPAGSLRAEASPLDGRQAANSRSGGSTARRRARQHR